MNRTYMAQESERLNYPDAQCAKAISAQGRLDSLDDRLIKLMATLGATLEVLAHNADRLMGSEPPPTPATLGPRLPEPVSDALVNRLFDRTSALLSQAEALSAQAHRFDSL